MSRFPRLFLAALACTQCLHLHAQSTLQAQLEVNLGPIDLDSYDGVSANNENEIASGPNVPECSFTGPQSNYRTCMQTVLAAYSRQGVTGVRFQFDMNGVGSTPFLNKNGALDPNWLAKLWLFFEDLRAADIQFVSFTPTWGTWGTGNMSIYACVSGPPGSYTVDNSCTNAVFYPWLPWGLTYSAAGGQGGPFDESSFNAYQDSPFLQAQQGAWQWSSSGSPCSTGSAPASPLFNFFDCIFGAVAGSQLQVRELDLYPEVPMWLSSIYGRLIYDPVQLVHPLSVINLIMQSHQLSPAAVLSTAAFQPGYAGLLVDCNSLYGDSALLVNATELLSAMTGGAFGRISGGQAANGNFCGNPIDLNDQTVLPAPTQQESPNWAGPTIIDSHSYPADAILDPGWGWIANPNSTGCQTYPDATPVTNVPTAGGLYTQNCSNDTNPANPTGSSQKAANMIYSAVDTFVKRWQSLLTIPANATVIVGETDQFNPGGIGRDGISFPAMAEGASCTTYGTYGSLLGDLAVDPANGVEHSVNYWCLPNWKWSAPWASSAAAENVAGFAATGLNRADVVMRPWAPVAWGTVLTPAPLSGNTANPYNVGACTFAPLGNVVLSPAGGMLPLSIVNQQNSRKCWWSAAPAPPAAPTASNPQLPAWLTATSPTWQQGSGTATFTYTPNTTTSARGPFLLTVAGSPVAVTQAGLPAAPVLSSPANGAANVSSSPTLTWSASANATGYQVYLGAAANLQLVATLPAGATSYAAGPLTYGAAYNWSVAATDAFQNSATSSTFSFTTAGQPLMTGSRVGLVRNNIFNFDSNGNGVGPASNDPADHAESFAPPGGVQPGDKPVVGDWTGDGRWKAGWFRASTGQWWLDANNDGAFDSGDFAYSAFGGPGDVPVIGDWAGLGKSAIGIVHDGYEWVLDNNANGVFEQPACAPAPYPNCGATAIAGDAVFAFGAPGDYPVVGNWNQQVSAAGFPISQAGMVRTYCTGTPCVPVGGPFLWLLDSAVPGSQTNVTPQNTHSIGNLPGVAYGGAPGDEPVTGDWYNTGVYQFGFRRQLFLWALDTATPLAPQTAHAVGFNFAYGGLPGDIAIVGKW